MTSKGGSSHIGSALSIADILAVLYGGFLCVDPSEPAASGRDRFILSKGHAGAAVYAALSERGFFPNAKLGTHYANGSDLSGHVSHKRVPGVELSTGSLGHGLGVATGRAKALKLQSLENPRVVVLMSDGECDEGSVWEAAMFASHHRLNNLIAVVDYNKIQSLASVSETIELEPFAEKWSSFGWHVLQANGHDHADLRKQLDASRTHGLGPTALIAHTTKGKGVSFMENSVLWHYRTAREEEFRLAALELGVMSEDWFG